MKSKIAFIGRSNVGKSSLINYLLEKKVALTSKHPGKTRKHDIFPFSTKIDFVDMPGYGYAKARGEKRLVWDKILLELFFEDEALQQIMVLIDSSISPMKIDQDFVAWLHDHKLPFAIIFTKIDKEKLSEISKIQQEWKKYLDSLSYDIVTFGVSAENKKGAGEIRKYITSLG
jgi:GTP-binding protein